MGLTPDFIKMFTKFMGLIPDFVYYQFFDICQKYVNGVTKILRHMMQMKENFYRIIALHLNMKQLATRANIINFKLFHVNYDAQLSHNKKLRITA
jgi:hypothetical protein